MMRKYINHFLLSSMCPQHVTNNLNSIVFANYIYRNQLFGFYLKQTSESPEYSVQFFVVVFLHEIRQMTES